MLPQFNASGVLPPFAGFDSSERSQSSPYEVSMTELVERFGHSHERRALLRHLLSYRQALRAAGIVTGFQLLDGSFTEDCERLRQRPPNDVDLVTFSHTPVPPRELRAFATAHGTLFDMDRVKEVYKCDSYFVDLSKDARYIVEDTMYFYGLFSHQRSTFMWKGLVKLPMRSDDDQALALLNAREADHA